MSRLSVLLLLSLLASGKSAIRGRRSEPLVGEEQRQSITSPQRELQVDAQCALRIATYRCDEVVATSQIEPVNGCDCYNFCGDAYDGCCAAGEACGIADCDTDLVPVAGCRLDGVVDTTPEPVCVVTFADGTVDQIFEGQSFGDLVTTACGPADEYPCECRTLSEDDNVRCPYCTFLTQDQDTVCARDGENVTFVDINGLTQECSCDYLGNNQGAVFCESVNPVPPEVCVSQGNTDQCTDVTEFVNPMEGCDCYNFCDGQFTGCCKYNEPCSTSCNSNNPDPDAEFVRGCEIDPNKPPVTQNPVETTGAPTQSPPSCPVEQNTELCPMLTINQAPVAGCGCYNYCGTTFQGCCPHDVGPCNVSCQVGEVLTAGCQLPEQSACKSYGTSCGSGTECCSGRCVFDSCQTPAPKIDTRPKLGAGLGGAGGRAKSGGVSRRIKEGAKIRGE
jgi:hypothetical protein